MGVVVKVEVGARTREAVAGRRAAGVVAAGVAAAGKSSVEPRSRVLEGNREAVIRWRVVAEV